MKISARFALAVATALQVAGLAAMPLGLRTAMWSVGGEAARNRTLTADPSGGLLSGESFGELDGTRGPASVTVRLSATDYNVLGVATRTGYTFRGWYTAKSGGVQVFGANGQFVAGDYWSDDGRWQYQSDVTVYARWKVHTHTVTFDANGGSGGYSQTQNYGSAITAPTVTRTGYTFTGWSPEVAAKVPDNDVTYTAQWSINKYTVTFDANGGTGGYSKQQKYRSAITAPTVERTGYTFTGWSPAVAAKVPANDVTYTAQWQRIKYNLTLNLNGGEGAGSIELEYGSTLGNITPPTRAGYAFLGWSIFATGDALGSDMPVSGNITLYAQWQALAYTIHYRRNDGSNFTSGPNAGLPFYEERSIDCGEEVTLPSHNTFGWSRRGMTFMGWARTQDDSKARRVWKRAGEKITDPVAAGEVLDLYAVWQLNSDAYAIVFIRNEGSGFLRTVGYNRGKKAKIPSINGLEWARRGFTFKGWAKTTADARNGVVWLTDAQEIIDLLPANKTSISVYAVWEIKSAYYALKFNKNDGSGAWRSVGYEYGVNTILPTIAAGLRWERPGYKFKGWAISKANADAGKVWKKDRGTVATGIPAGTQKDIYAIWVPIAGTEVATPTATADDTAITPVLLPAGHYSGILADGTGTYDLIADAGLTGYILVNGADGIVEGECTLSVTPDSLTATLDGETIELELP